MLKEQGRGSFGEVWLAQDEQLDNMQVAIKIYIALDDRGIEEFKKEYKTAYKLNHPNLLHAYHFDICDKRPYLVMPYCPESALSLIGNCDRETLWRFIKDVSSGLAYLHSLDIIHHDIKPDNILRAEDGSFAITDFGISTKMRSTLRRNSTRAINQMSSGGSLPYMGPEMFTAKAESVKATDIWAFGVTLYEMITGDLPFFGQGGVMQLNGAAIPDLEYEDPEIVRLVQACMSKNTWDRPTAEDISISAQEQAFHPNAERADKEIKTTEAGATVPFLNNDLPTSKKTDKATSEPDKEITPPSSYNPKRKKRTLLWGSLSLGVILLIILIATYNPERKAAKEAFPKYSSLVQSTRSALSSGITAENIATIRQNINSLKSLEAAHSKNDKRFSEASSIERGFNSKIQSTFDAYVSAANSAKASDVKADNYYKALQIKEDATIRERYNSLADKLNGIKRVDFVMIYRDDKNETYADRIDYRLKDGKLVIEADAKPLVASKVTYMDIYFEFQDFEGATKKYNKQTFYVKILKPDGSLMTGKSSPEGYTYKYTVDLSEGMSAWEGHCVNSPKVWCLGWGNDQKTAYKAGTYKVQVYNKGRQLFSVPVIFK